MKLRVFRSEKGDCLLLTSRNGHRMLIDGGMAASYTEHAAPALGELSRNNAKLDLVYISHIDRDHISGVLQMLDDEAAWRVHDYQLAHGNPNHPAPASPRPPKIGGIWHNAFHEQVGANAGKVEDALAASAPYLLAADDALVRAVGEHQAGLVQSIPEAIRVSRRISAGQLKIPLNKQFGGKLVTVEGTEKVARIGTVRLSVIGPFASDVTKLRGEWNKWLAANAASLAAIQAQAAEDEAAFATHELAWPASYLIALGNELGARSKVTTPNLASIMLLAEEGAQKVLLTGDGHSSDILKGLKKRQKLDANDRLHVEILKFQHHGSEHNVDQAFCDQVTADHYVFCGNGEHANPDLRVLSLVAERRKALADGRPFKFWFNSSSTVSETQAGREHMAKVEERVAELEAGAAGLLSSQFLGESSFEIDL